MKWEEFQNVTWLRARREGVPLRRVTEKRLGEMCRTTTRALIRYQPAYHLFTSDNSSLAEENLR